MTLTEKALKIYDRTIGLQCDLCKAEFKYTDSKFPLSKIAIHPQHNSEYGSQSWTLDVCDNCLKPLLIQLKLHK